MSDNALLGIDLGTSGVKAVVLAGNGGFLGEADAGYPVLTQQPGWAETPPADWWAATVLAVRQALSQARAGTPGLRIGAIGVDGQMHGLVLTDQAGEPVRPALLWADQRAQPQARRYAALPGPTRAALANPISPGMTGPLLRWVADHEPDQLTRARWALLPKDWIRHRLTGVLATEPSDASATLLWDVPANTWSADVLAALDLPAHLLPEVLDSAAAAGTLTPAAADELGLPHGIPVATGAGDTPAALLATGLTPGEVQLTVGSGAQLVAATDTATGHADPVVHLYRTAASHGWYQMGAVQNAGLALDWARRVLNADWPEVYAASAAGEPGAGGVVFVPHLTGERTPVLDASATASLTGLRLSHDRATVLQAVAEGVAFAIRHAADALLAALPGPTPTSFRLAGGGTRDPHFRQLLADVLGVPLEPIRARSASAVGAATLAATAANLPTPQAQLVREAPITPGARSEHYRTAFTRYAEAVHQQTSAREQRTAAH